MSDILTGGRIVVRTLPSRPASAAAVMADASGRRTGVSGARGKRPGGEPPTPAVAVTDRFV